MRDLDKAITLAGKIHKGQKDRYGASYILHPLRIMMKMETTEGKIVAILHDVVEDSDLTVQDIENQGFEAAVSRAVDSLSRREGEKYDDYIERVKDSPLAVLVKLADLEDNMDIRRAENVDDELFERLRKYHRAWKNLKQHLDSTK